MRVRVVRLESLFFLLEPTEIEKSVVGHEGLVWYLTWHGSLLGALARKPCKASSFTVAPLDGESAFCSLKLARLRRGAFGHENSVVLM